MGDTRIERYASQITCTLSSTCLPTSQQNLGKALLDFDFLQCLFVDPMAKAMTPNSLFSLLSFPYSMSKSLSSCA